MSGNKFIAEGIDEAPGKYVSDDEINTILQRGEILQHKRDFWLIPEGKMWQQFNKDFVCGVILKYIPSRNNLIDYEAVERQRKKYELGKKAYNSLSLNRNGVLSNEMQLLRNPHISSPAKKENTFAQKNGRGTGKKRNNLKFLDLSDNMGDRDRLDNDVSRHSIDEESVNVSSYEPEFLKASKYAPEDQNGSYYEEEEVRMGSSQKFRDRGQTARYKNKKLPLDSFPSNSPHSNNGDHESFLNTSSIQPHVERLNVRRNRDVANKSFVGAQYFETEPFKHDHGFDKTYTRFDDGFLTDSRGRPLERASDDFEANRPSNISCIDPMVESPPLRRGGTGTINIYNIVGFENTHYD